jgi:hypothetical protein
MTRTRRPGLYREPDVIEPAGAEPAGAAGAQGVP